MDDTSRYVFEAEASSLKAMHESDVEHWDGRFSNENRFIARVFQSAA